MIGSGFIKLRADDNVVIALEPLSAGTNTRRGASFPFQVRSNPVTRSRAAAIAKG